MKNKFFVTIIAAIALLASGCNGATANKVVPTYQGMTISKTTRGMRVDNHKNLGDEQEGQDEVPPEDDEHQEETGEEGKDIENIVTIEVEGDEETKYYVKPNEKFIIEVHVSNPSDFEIQSFTLNGNKYANYMFKEGSTMELLLLETTAPSTSGYIEYTIDAIKYIDGTEIKDVRMDGDKTIKAGVAYANGPTATIKSQVVNPTSISLDINVKDTNSLIGDNELAIYLTDGENVVASKPLVVGDNDVLFDNLIMSKNYEYGVVAAFDMVDGKGLHSEWLVKDVFKTLGAFSIDSVTLDKTSIEFEISKNGDNGEIDSISLYDAATDKLVAHGNKDTRRFDNLLSDHEYNLYVDFTYQLGEEILHDFASRKNAKTEAKVVPTIEVKNDVVTDLAIKADYEVTDPDSIGVINSVELYKGNTLVNTNVDKDIDFENLDSFSEYKVVINYSYDLNDGNGMQNAKVEKEYKTSPHLEFVSCRIINTSAVSEGDTIYMQVSLVNPSGTVPSSVVVNGEEYLCSGSTTQTKIFVEIVNNGQFKGGDTTLTIEKVNMAIDGVEYYILPTTNNSDHIFINGTLEVVSLAVTDAEYNLVDWVFPSQKSSLVALLTLDNETDYEIYEISVSNQVTASDKIVPTKIDKNHYYFEAKGTSVQLQKLSYRNAYIDKTITYSPFFASNDVYCLDSNEIHYVSTVDDLSSMGSNNHYYELVNDIDLSGREWMGKQFAGVFDGKGHTISNMSLVKNISDSSVFAIGLFSGARGVICNLNISDVLVLATIESRIEYGPLAGGVMVRLIVDNCHVKGDSSVSLTVPTNDESCIGGLVGTSYRTSSGIVLTAKNCSSNAYITTKGFAKTGGICGMSGDSLFENCVFSGSINAENSAGGIVGHSQNSTYKNCESKGTITSTQFAGGIVGYSYQSDKFIDCVNSGNVSGNIAAGIVTSLGGSTITPDQEKNYIKNCKNSGKIEGTERAAGICAQGGGAILNCENTGAIKAGSSAAGIFCSVNSALIEDCINKGTITANIAGGIVGDAKSNTITIKNCGNIDSNFIGSGDCILENCYVIGDNE